MRTISCTRALLGHPIRADITILDAGVHILLTGGTTTHIGAVSLCSEGGLQTLEEKHHKESIISSLWAKTLYRIWGCPVTVACGIHYDHASQEEIRLIVAETEAMLEQVKTNLLKK